MISASGRAALVGAFVAALATLPGLGVGTLWDNSETAYGEVAREILLSHSWIVMHLNGEPWFIQPPLYFWIAAAFAAILGTTEFALRLPSAIATIALSATLGYVVARCARERVAVLAAVVLSTSLMQAIVGRLAIMDALLDLAVGVAILGWYAALRAGSRLGWYAGWIAVALGTLAKGPVAPVVALLVVVPWALWERAAGAGIRAPSARRWAGAAAVFAVVVGPWAFALWRAAGVGSFDEMLGHYTVGRYLGTIENQSGPVWYYVPVIVLGFFPWIAYLAPAFALAARAVRDRAPGSLARLAIAWTVLPFAFFSFAETKLPNSVALELPALAIVVAFWLDRAIDARDRRAALGWSALVPVAIVTIGIAMRAFSHDNRLTADLAALLGDFIALGVALLLGSAATFVLFARRSTGRFAPYALATASVAVMSIIAIAETRAEAFKPVPPLAAAIDRARRPGDLAAIWGVSGGNALVFYTRPGVAKIVGDAPDGGTSELRATICSSRRVFVVTSAQRARDLSSLGRERRTVATSGRDVLLLFAGAPCVNESALKTR